MNHSVNQIRTAFLDYFAGKKHEVVASSPLLPHNDPSLMFVNAGMVQFKNLFTGVETRDYKRATTSQKCVRAGGKHNDLDNVGYTARHHTFFEMLGNFSFGDYFKEEAISYAWEFLTKTIGIAPEKLLVTVYHDDDVAFDLWKKIAGFSDDKIIRIASKDNFWAMGDTGPCGPCSEIFYDHGEEIPGGPPGSPDEDGDRFVEIWNLVFMQYEQMPDKRIDLPAPSIDTGMGIERLATVLQGVHDNYEIDLFQKLIESSKLISGNDKQEHQVSHRVIADHLRSCSFLLADGVMPSNEGRGYVLRRIMRRAMRHVHNLGVKEPMMYKLVPALIEEMGSAYPELIRAEALIKEILFLEEQRFKETLGRGLKLLASESESLKAGDSLKGETAFKLYDTYGFPLDLTIDILRSRNISVDEKIFEQEMAKQKERARAAWKGSGEDKISEVWFEIEEKSGVTEFTGYTAQSGQGEIQAILLGDQKSEQIKQGDEAIIILNQTPFYGESGGQEGDKGLLKTTTGGEFEVSDTKKMLGSIHAHIGKVKKGIFKQGEVIEAFVDDSRRKKLRANHSATHILHAVLRKQLGDHVTQKGSLVAEDKFRFDFSHPKALSKEEIDSIEKEVNEIISHNSEVGTKLMSTDDAIKAGAMALFGEKYGDEVRVVNMGPEANSEHFSVELCGGTHVKRTGDIGLFKIVAESAIAAGVRRLECVTGSEAISYINNRDQIITEAALMLKTSPDNLLERVENLANDKRTLEKQIAELKKQIALGGGSNDDTKIEKINGINFIGKIFADVAPKDLRDIVMDLKSANSSVVISAASSFEGKGSLIIAVSDDLVSKVSAVDLVKESAEALGAKGGGGKPNFAQTGGPNGDGAKESIEKIKQYLAKL